MGAIQVAGVGKIAAKPDVAVISFTVQTEGKKTSDAVHKNNLRMAELMAVVETFSIAPKDRKTYGFGIQPSYDYGKSGRANPKITGYIASNGLNIKIREIDKVSDILGALSDANATGMNLAFTVDNPQQYEDEARKLAMQDALRRANLYATTSGVKLGVLDGMTEHVGYGNRNSPLRAMSYGSSAGGAPESVPVEAGEQEVTVQINASYLIGTPAKKK